ncbi:TIGR04084 family radical SAM/SPASM domain-containing protein [archaeon]|nr:TIGR04084 family radical SAM/SPASM domain-containing protein [archaeon]
MHYHIILTEVCNLKCKYCYEKSMIEFDNGLEEKWDYEENIPFDSEVSIERLKKFLKPTDTLIFYGGEPLVRIDKMKEIMDNVDCRFCIQTNGIFLDKVPFEYIKRLDKMLVSIDGTRERDVENKGALHYDKAISNVRMLREKGYTGEIVARMVISKPDVYEQVMAILDLGLFDSIHWQIDAGFYKNDFDGEEFSKFVEEYNVSIDRLLDWWFENLSAVRRTPNCGKKGHKLYPFVGILNRIKDWDKETRLPCGAGYANFTINTKGDLSACPIMNSVKNFYCGSVDKGVKKEIDCGNWCESCSHRDICGGRCLYSNYAQLWPKEGHDLICKTIKHLIDGIRERSEGLELDAKDFEYEKYFGPEIIP